jgi:hypothetical protein
MFNAPNATQVLDGKKPMVRFGSTDNDIQGKICLFQNTGVSLLKGYESRLKKLCHTDIWQKEMASYITVDSLRISAPDATSFLTWKLKKPVGATLEVIFPPQLLKAGAAWQTEVSLKRIVKEQPRPKSVTVNCGDIQVRFDNKKFWTMNRVEYKGKRLGIDKPASHYGTVFNFPGTGFIGTGHTENESEIVDEISFQEGTTKLGSSKDNASVNATSFSMKRKSRVRDFSIDSSIKIKDNIIDQQTTITAGKATRLALIFNFMHPWTVNMTDYLAAPLNGEIESGSFTTCGKRLVNKEMDWVAFYNANNKTGTVMLLAERADKGGAMMQLWDVAPYRKFYLNTFKGQVFPKGYTAHYRMLVGFFEVEVDDWKQSAEKTLQKLRETASQK